MKFDRNTVIGLVVLAALFFGFFYITNKQNAESQKQKNEELAVEKLREDSIAKLNNPKDDSIRKKTDSIVGAMICHSAFNLGMIFCIFYLM